MGKMTTVCGPADPKSILYGQVHEHIFVRQTPMAAKNPALQLDQADLSLQELLSYRAAGGGLLVDAQPVGAGRDAEILCRLSEESGVSIMASTGYHLLGFYKESSPLHRLSREALYTLYLSELTKGMLPFDAGDQLCEDRRLKACAGIVKAAIPGEGPKGRYETLLCAAARAAADGQAPLMLHTECGAHAEEAIALCISQGLRPDQMVVCHVDRQAEDFSVHERIAEKGVYLDYDTIGRFRYHSDEAEISLLRHMVEKGYASQILLALDTTAARLAAYGGEIGLCYLLEQFYPQLCREDFEEQVLERFSILNLRALFNG